MKALQIDVNGEIIVAGIKDGTVSLIVTISKKNETEKVEINVTGLNKMEMNEPQLEYLYWKKSELNENDNLSLKIIETENISTPIESKKVSKTELSDMKSKDSKKS